MKTGVDSTPETLCEKHFSQWIPSNKFCYTTTMHIRCQQSAVWTIEEWYQVHKSVTKNQFYIKQASLEQISIEIFSTSFAHIFSLYCFLSMNRSLDKFWDTRVWRQEGSKLAYHLKARLSGVNMDQIQIISFSHVWVVALRRGTCAVSTKLNYGAGKGAFSCYDFVRF